MYDSPMIDLYNWDGQPALVVHKFVEGLPYRQDIDKGVKAWTVRDWVRGWCRDNYHKKKWTPVYFRDVEQFGEYRCSASFAKMFPRLPPPPREFWTVHADTFGAKFWDAENMPETRYYDWQGRPAVITGKNAWAVLPNRGSHWHEVDWREVEAHGLIETRRDLTALFGDQPPLPIEAQLEADCWYWARNDVGPLRDGNFRFHYLDIDGRPSVLARGFREHGFAFDELKRKWVGAGISHARVSQFSIPKSKFDAKFSSLPPLPDYMQKLQRLLLPAYDPNHGPHEFVFCGIYDNRPVLIADQRTWTVHKRNLEWREIDSKDVSSWSRLRALETVEQIFELPPFSGEMTDAIADREIFDPWSADLTSKVSFSTSNIHGRSTGRPVVFAGLRAWILLKKGEEWREIDNPSMWPFVWPLTQKKFDEVFENEKLAPYPNEIQRALQYLPVEEEKANTELPRTI